MYPVNLRLTWIPDSRFATAGMTKSVLVMKALPRALTCSPKEYPEQYTDQMPLLTTSLP
jgi:hypothetical protein